MNITSLVRHKIQNGPRLGICNQDEFLMLVSVSDTRFTHTLFWVSAYFRMRNSLLRGLAVRSLADYEILFVLEKLLLLTAWSIVKLYPHDIH